MEALTTVFGAALVLSGILLAMMPISAQIFEEKRRSGSNRKKFAAKILRYMILVGVIGGLSITAVSFCRITGEAKTLGLTLEIVFWAELTLMTICALGLFYVFGE